MFDELVDCYVDSALTHWTDYAFHVENDYRIAELEAAFGISVCCYGSD
jgi:hypothetical protein